MVSDSASVPGKEAAVRLKLEVPTGSVKVLTGSVGGALVCEAGGGRARPKTLFPPQLLRQVISPLNNPREQQSHDRSDDNMSPGSKGQIHRLVETRGKQSSRRPEPREKPRPAYGGRVGRGRLGRRGPS